MLYLRVPNNLNLWKLPASRRLLKLLVIQTDVQVTLPKSKLPLIVPKKSIKMEQ